MQSEKVADDCLHAATVLLHLYHLLVLIWDERPIFFASEDEEQLWRLFYRRSGMGRLEMRIALKLGRWGLSPKPDVNASERRLELATTRLVTFPPSAVQWWAEIGMPSG